MWNPTASTAVLLTLLAEAAISVPAPQIAFDVAGQNASWATPPPPDTTDHLVFNSVSSLLQRWPNNIYMNGHTIIPASIPPGTVLYHGRADTETPTVPEWLAFDPDHAYIFTDAPSPGDGHYLFSFVAIRELRLAYFDGSSGAMTTDGTLDSQDVLIWGRPRPDKRFAERERLDALCAWGRPLAVDGFLRMVIPFEVMLCDLSDGLEIVTLLDVLPRDPPKEPPTRRRPSPHPEDPTLPVPSDIPDDPHPRGWKGSLPSATFSCFQMFVSASWRDRAPGETAVHVDYSGFVTFYDPSLTSLGKARRGVPRLKQRAGNISSADMKRVQAELADVFTRRTAGSGVDWASITHVVVERYAERLELLKYTLEPKASVNVTQRAAVVRTQLLTMLVPYITIDGVPTSDGGDTSWAAPIVDRCSTTQTSRIPTALLSPQERLILRAVEGTQHEICRRLTLMWVQVFDIELQTDESTIRSVLASLRTELLELMAWLDWSVWIKCDPACTADEMCYVATWPYAMDDDPTDLTPRCISRIDPPNLGNSCVSWSLPSGPQS